MEPQNEPADPIAKGIIPRAKQNFADLFRWKQRVEITNENGETRCEWQSPPPLKNPISLLMMLDAKGWLFFLVGFCAWGFDAFDFHALAIQTVKLAAYFKTTNTQISTAITLTLLLRSVGAAIFGLIGDKYGRKYPMVLNLIVLGILQIGTIYCNTFSQFLAVRSLFGLFMGGIWGNSIAMALENCPVDARGLMSGLLQQAYCFGYVLAACANLGVGGSTESWKIVFWIGAGLSIGIGFVRLLIPESKQFIEAKTEGRRTTGAPAGAFWRATKHMLRDHWKMAIYMIYMMSWYNFLSHASQDSYTTFVLQEKELDNSQASRASILMQTGSIVGGTIVGYISQFVGRRRALVVAALVCCFIIPAWILPNTERGLSVGAFFLQFCIQGAFGAIPVHLNELSPPAYRSSFPGTCYQIGNMISAPSAQIVNAVAESNYITSAINGKLVPAYGRTMAIAVVVIEVGIVIAVAFGPENRGAHFELAPAAGVEEMLEQKRMDIEGTRSDSKTEKEAEVVEIEDTSAKR